MRRSRVDLILFLVVLLQTASDDASAQSIATASNKPAVDVVGVAMASGTADAPLSGTLFFSDRDRRQLDQQRSRPKKTATQAGNDIEVGDSRSVINGYVRRGDGWVTVWVDGVVIDRPDAQLAGKVSATSVGNSMADVRVMVKDDLTTVSADAQRPARKPARKQTKTKAKAR